MVEESTYITDSVHNVSSLLEKHLEVNMPRTFIQTKSKYSN